MKSVICEVEEFSNVNGTIASSDPQGKISPDPEISPRHVLVVDDEPLIRWSVSEALVDMGMDVEEASDATSALRAITTAARPFDAVVLDLRLPDMDDLSLLGTLRQLLPKATLILMTAFGTPEVVADAQAMGATVLNKPFELDDLKHLIAT
jgi:DNA-binding NtrC family response regulator